MITAVTRRRMLAGFAGLAAVSLLAACSPDEEEDCDDLDLKAPKKRKKSKSRSRRR